MAERDPFGRLPDENPLAFLGGTSNGTEAAAAATTAAEEATPAEQPRFTEQPAAKRPRAADVARTRAAEFAATHAAAGLRPANVARITGRVVKTVVGVWVLMVVLVGLLALVFASGESDTDGTSSATVQARDDAAPESARPNAAPPPPPAARPAATPRGLNASSLLTRRKLAPALRRLGTSGLGRLYSLSVRPERIDAQLLTRGGRLRSVQVRSDGKLNDFGASGPGFGHLGTIAFARVQAGAPERLARSAAGRLHRAASQVDYVVLVLTGAQLTWSVFMRDGKHFIADARGRITRRIS